MAHVTNAFRSTRQGGTINKHELVAAMLAYGEPITDSQAEDLISGVDVDRDGEMSWPELLEVIMAK